MANYVKFKQGLKKDFNTTNQPLTNGMIYFVIDENNHGSIYYDTIVDGKKATKNGTVHRVKFSGLPIKITGSVIGTGVISQDGETIEINTSTNHSHGLAHQDFTVTLSDDDTNLKWTRLGNQNGGSFWLKSIRGQTKAPAWFLPDYSAGIAFGGADTKGIISVRYSQPGVRFAGGNGDAPVWYFTITGSNDKSYDLNGIGGHSSDSAKLDHNVTFKIASTANATKGGNGTATNLSGSAVDLYLPTRISGFDLLQATRFQGNADTSTVAAKLGRGGNTSLPMTFNWNGQGGQPTWLWGGENGTNMYVYNPSNFRVAHSVNTAGLDHNITFKISKVADATIGETGITTNLTKNAITFTIPSDLSGFNNIQSTRFQGTADNADNAVNADKLDNYHASEVYKAATHTINNYSSVNDWVRIATIKIGGTGLSTGGFTAILSNRECLDSSSFILTVAICRNSTKSVDCQAFYTLIGSASPRQIIVRSNDGVNFYVYFKSVLNSWTTYYNVTKIMTENNVTFENVGVSSANLIAGSVLNVTAVKGGSVDRATDADTVDGYHADAFVKKAGDTMSGPLTFANRTCNVVGNDCGMGDINSAGTLAFQGKNGATNLWLVQYGEAWSASANHATISYDGTKVSCDKPFYGAVWNDYAEYRKTHHEIEPGRCVIEVGDGSLTLAFDRMQPGGNIVSDTYGFAIGEAKECKTPLAVSGRVLAYPYEDRDSYQAGDPVCSGPNGTVSKMTREEVREYPDRIIGTVSEIPDYEIWGTGNVKVNNRIWIKVK